MSLKTLNSFRSQLCMNNYKFLFLNSLKKRYVKEEKTFSLTSCVLDNKRDESSKCSQTVTKNNEKRQPGFSRPYFVEKKNEEIVKKLKKGDDLDINKEQLKKTGEILLKDLQIGVNKTIHFVTDIKVGDLEYKYFPKETDILIIGNSPAGLMAAYEIKKKFPYGPKVTIIDRNSEYPHASTNLGQGILMQQFFNDKEEIQMSQYCAEFLSGFHRHTEVNGHPQFNAHFEPLGGLLLADKNNEEKLMLKIVDMQHHGIHHKILNQESLKKKFPWLKLDNILFGVLGLANEGVFDPWSFLIALKSKVFNLGVNFINAEVIDFGMENYFLNKAICKFPDGSYKSIDFNTCVISVGMDVLKLVDIINNIGISPVKVNLPLVEKKRYEFCFYYPDGPGLDTPIVFDVNGVYFRREGLNGHYVAGVASIPSDNNKENSIFNVFNNKIKPFLMERIFNFEKLELVNGWADSYEFNLGNEVGIIGPHPLNDRLYYISGFNHVGLQYIPAVGRAVMEYILYDDYQTINMKPYHIDYLYHKQHLKADQLRKELIASKQRMALKD